MFESLTSRLQETLQNLRGQGRLSEDNIKDALRDVRMALLEADVALSVVRDFIESVRVRAIGQEVMKSLTPGQAFIKIVNDELVKVLGQANQILDLRAVPPAVVLMAGLQGAGKTTSTAKLAKFLTERQKKKVMLVSCDVYRPAAIQQLATVGEQVGVTVFPSYVDQNPAEIAESALAAARKGFYDVLIVDTAGRLAIDEAMMTEVKSLHQALNPAETLFVVDAMTGQDAANTAKAFGDALPLTGVILTKIDGDARGGAALSVRQITGKPIKFLGIGEKLEALEPFHPDRLASRILGMGDILTLIEEVERKADQDKAEKLMKKLAKGKRFDFEDMRDQLQQMLNMGGVAAMMDKLPAGMNMKNLPMPTKNADHDKEIKRMVALINSMTPKERRYPDLLKASRKQRIAKGAGLQVQDVNKLIKQFMQMETMMQKMNKGGLQKMMRVAQAQMARGGGMNGIGRR